jgi:hypothetical protein
MTTRRKPILATRVSPVVDNVVRILANTLGITISEYLRKLILDDLESKRVFNGHFTKTIGQTEPEEPKEKPEAHI